MLVKAIMTAKPVSCDPADTLDAVAKLMLERNCGEVLVCDGETLLGVITDRDIALRAVALGRTTATVPAREVMTTNVYRIRENDEVNAALDMMQKTLVRRLPVVDENGKIVGIVSQSDLIAKLPASKVARVIKAITKKAAGRVPAEH